MSQRWKKTRKHVARRSVSEVVCASRPRVERRWETKSCDDRKQRETTYAVCTRVWRSFWFLALDGKTSGWGTKLLGGLHKRICVLSEAREGKKWAWCKWQKQGWCALLVRGHQSCCVVWVNATENEGAEGISLLTERQTHWSWMNGGLKNCDRPAAWTI